MTVEKLQKTEERFQNGFPEPVLIRVSTNEKGEMTTSEVTYEDILQKRREVQEELLATSRNGLFTGRPKKPGSGHPRPLRELRDIREQKKKQEEQDRQRKKKIAGLNNERKLLDRKLLLLFESSPPQPLRISVNRAGKKPKIEVLGGERLDPVEAEWREYLVRREVAHLWGSPGVELARETFELRRAIRHATSGEVTQLKAKLDKLLGGEKGVMLGEIADANSDFRIMLSSMQDFIDQKALGKVDIKF